MGAFVPTFFALEFQRSFLQFTPREQSREFHQFLGATANEIVGPYTKFESEASEQDPELVHLKSCFNNRYWVRQSPTSNFIVAAADEIEEDQSKWSCTLFRPFREAWFKLRHVASRQNIVILDFQPYVGLGFNLLSDAANADDSRIIEQNRDGFRIVDWAPLVMLPRFVAFKGDNRKCLSARVVQGDNHLQFISDNNDGSDPSVIHEMTHAPFGGVRFRSFRFNRFWMYMTNGRWILANSVDGSDAFSEFNVQRTDVDTVILRSAGMLVCHRHTADRRDDCLASREREVVSESRLVFEECVKSREIIEIQYRLQDAKIYDDKHLRADSVTAKNYDENKDDNAILSYTFTKTISSSWSSTNSVTTGVAISVKGRIPFIAKVETELSIEYTHSRETSETSEITEEIGAEYSTTMPAGHSVTIFGNVRQASAYIPYSYTQIDTLFDDRKISTRKHDGVYHGCPSSFQKAMAVFLKHQILLLVVRGATIRSLLRRVQVRRARSRISRSSARPFLPEFGAFFLDMHCIFCIMHDTHVC